jgi:hypothetical protein
LAFLANGIAFTSGEADVQAAFTSVNRAAALSDAAHSFKAALATMRLNVRDFAVKPTPDLVLAFSDSRKHAIKNLDIIEGSLTDVERNDITRLRYRVSAVAGFFAELANEHEALGFNENEGARHLLKDAETKIERFVNVDMKTETAWWLGSNDAQLLLASLSTLRRYGAEYRLTPDGGSRSSLRQRAQQIQPDYIGSRRPAGSKEQLTRHVTNYSASLK